MKIRFIKMLSILCAVMLMISAVSAWAAAEEDPATPTDLNPIEEDIREEDESDDGPVDSIEILITKDLKLGQSWEGTVGKTKPAVLKLDVERAGTVYMLLESKDAWATVEKSDRVTGNAPHNQVNPETDELIYSWEAEAGSYIITVGPIEPNLLAMVKVTFMTAGAYDAWEEARDTEEDNELEEAETEPEEEIEPEQGEETKIESEEEQNQQEDDSEKNSDIETESEPENAEKELDGESENKPEGETENKPEGEQATESETADEGMQQEEQQEENKHNSGSDADRSVFITISWDTDDPAIGDVAHFRSVLSGYDGLTYTLQWQTSWDQNQWTDYANATEPNIDVMLTEELDGVYFRLVVYLEEEGID